MEENDELDEKPSGASVTKAIQKAKSDSKIVIEEKDFVLISTHDYGHFYDLYLLKTVKPKGKPERDEFKLDGYGMPLSAAVRFITMNRISRNQTGESMNLQEFLERFEKALKDLKDSCRIK